jgi:hypothetical protein
MGKESYTMSPIKTCMKNFGPKRLGYKRKGQGSSDPNSPWAKARLNWDTQLLARLGELSEEELKALEDPDTGELPKWYDIKNLTSLKLDKIVWWDETHKKCAIGGGSIGKNREKLCFPRDENGKVDTKNGKYDMMEPSYLNVKYKTEIRFCLGCAPW